MNHLSLIQALSFRPVAFWPYHFSLRVDADLQKHAINTHFLSFKLLDPAPSNASYELATFSTPCHACASIQSRNAISIHLFSIILFLAAIYLPISHSLSIFDTIPFPWAVLFYENPSWFLNPSGHDSTIYQ